jgi:ABC-2 type transport system permease protein
MAIFRHHLRQEAGALLGWAIALVVLAVLQTSLYQGLSAQGMSAQLEQVLHTLPPQIVQFVGGSLNLFNVAGWISAINLSGWLALLVAIWVALASVSVVAADVDRHTFEFLLALPVRRGTLLLQRLLSLLLQLALLYLGIFLAINVALMMMGQGVIEGRLAGALFSLFLDQVALAGTLLLLSLAFRDQTYAVLATVTAAAVFILVPVVVDASSPVAFLRNLTPFDYGAAGMLMTQGVVPGGHTVLTVIWAVIAILAAYVIFQRREV